jgi:glycosyltransferase involved in cell wall biosynthesis
MQEEADQALSEGIEAFHVVHRRVPLRGASYPLYLWAAVAAYRRLLAKGFRPDIIHAHVYGAGVPAALIATRSRLPFVLTEHFSGIAQRSLSRTEIRKARYAYKRAARLLPVSRFLREAIRSYGVEGAFEVVPNAVDTSFFYPRDAERSKTAGPCRMLFVGNLEPSHEKGFPTLVEALAKLHPLRQTWHLDVIGDGAARAGYEVSAAARGLDERMTFHGSQPKTAVAELMRTADLLVLPSRVETFGAVVAEALACGVPVVATATGGIPEVLQESDGRLVPPDDPAALADAVHDTLEHLDRFDPRAISAAARDRYSLEAVGDRLSEIYEAVRAPIAAGGHRDARRRVSS